MAAHTAEIPDGLRAILTNPATPPEVLASLWLPAGDPHRPKNQMVEENESAVLQNALLLENPNCPDRIYHNTFLCVCDKLQHNHSADTTLAYACLRNTSLDLALLQNPNPHKLRRISIVLVHIASDLTLRIKSSREAKGIILPWAIFSFNEFVSSLHPKNQLPHGASSWIRRLKTMSGDLDAPISRSTIVSLIFSSIAIEDHACTLPPSRVAWLISALSGLPRKTARTKAKLNEEPCLSRMVDRAVQLVAPAPPPSIKWPSTIPGHLL